MWDPAMIIASSLSFATVALATTRHAFMGMQSLQNHGWTKRSEVTAQSSLSMSIALSQSNIDNVYGLLMNVSDPDSPHYGAWYTKEQITNLFRPSHASTQRVLSWLQSHGIESRDLIISKSKGEIYFKTSVGTAEKMLNAKYHSYEHSSGKLQYGCDEYHLPNDITKDIDFITPTLPLPIKSTKPTTSNSAKSQKIRHVTDIQSDSANFCSNKMTPACLRQLYNMPELSTQYTESLLGIVEFSPNSYVSTDIEQFFDVYSPNQIYRSPTVISINGGIAPQDESPSIAYSAESNLDLQFSMTLLNGSPVTLFQIGSNQLGGSFNTFLDVLDSSYCSGDNAIKDPVYSPADCGTASSPPVLSVSYGYDESSLPAAYAIRQCNEWAKLGMLGITVIFSSGDYGVAGNRAVCLPSGGFNPSFASTCPYVTSVGATQIVPGTLSNEEALHGDAISGGGFSNNFALPLYQVAAVSGYYASASPNYLPGIYNDSRNARGYPDISANGQNYPIIVGGEEHTGYGTSAAAPIVASMFALIVARRKAAGLSSLGFVNPMLYNNPSVFQDITNGNNANCNLPGFEAVKGWDPVTGLGTPDFEKLSSLFV